ncbi:MAG: alpha-E domain-containing protein [Planctomycetes bacterium]|nr:alpha-E domain-containing protein [Planctomycetota bacterium]
MLSRVADSIYWMARYIERAENIARFVDVNLRLMLDLPGGSEDQWQPLVDITGDREWFAERYGAASREKVIRFLTFDKEYSNSIFSCLRAARENARMVRETISSEMWEQVNTFYLMVHDAASSDRALESPHDFFSSVKTASHLFVGVTETTMSHGEGWHFGLLGRFLERADKTSRLLEVKYFILLPSVADVGTPYDDMHWSALLRSASALEMYRKRHGPISPNRVVDFLLLDREFPRSVRYCLNLAQESLHAISGTPLGTFGNLAEQRLGQLQSELAYAHADEIIREGLEEFLDAFQTKLNLTGEAIFETFIALRPKKESRP